MTGAALLLIAAGCRYTVPFEGDTAACESPEAWYLDGDGDGLGAGEAALHCAPPDGYVSEAGDCDDGRASVSPAAAEILYDGLDNDCDEATVDDDYDGDGYLIAEDCRDNDAAVNPDAVEICGDGKDNDCDGHGGDCQPTGLIELSGADAKLLGEAAGDGLGGSGSWAGDVNGDGLDDLFIGAPTYTTADGESAGAAYLIYGARRGLKSISEADARIEGATREQKLSGLIAGAGDVDGDGYSDLLLGSKALSTGSVQGTGGADVGPAYLVYGGEDLYGVRSVASGSVTLDNDGASGVFVGASGGGPVDMDGDGLSDVLLGIWRVYSDRDADGAAYLFSGAGLTSGTVADADWKLLGDDSGAAIQYSVGGLNAYVVVGAPKSDEVHEDGGAVYLVPTGALPPGEYLLRDAADHVMNGEFPLAEVGRSVSGAGDVNGDGHEDLIIGSWEQETQDGGDRYQDAGAAYLVYGPLSERPASLVLSDADVKLLGYQTELWVGRPVGSAGDVDGDTFGDVVVGGGLVNPSSNTNADSRAFVIMGPVPPGTWWLDQVAEDGPTIGIFKEERRGDWGGSTIIGVGDMNGDEHSDIAVGASNESTLQEGAGAVYLFTANGI